MNVSQVVRYRKLVKKQKVEEEKLIKVKEVKKSKVKKILNKIKIKGVVKYSVQ